MCLLLRVLFWGLVLDIKLNPHVESSPMRQTQVAARTRVHLCAWPLPRSAERAQRGQHLRRVEEEVSLEAPFMNI